MALAQFKVTAAPGSSKVEVNGEDVSARVQTVQFVHGAGPEVPTLILHEFVAGSIEGEGVVQVVPPEQAAARDELVNLIDKLDPAEVERAALNDMGWGDDSSVAQAVFEYVKKALRGTA